MNILYIVNEPRFFLSHRLPIAIAAQKQGYTVHVATKAGDTVQDILDKGFIHHTLLLSRNGSNISNELASLVCIWKLIHKVKPDILHLVTIKPVLYGGIASRFSSTKKVVAAISGLGTLFLAEGRKAELKRKIGMSLYRLALHSKNVTIIFQNPDDRELFIGLKAVCAKQTSLIRGSGVDLLRFQYVPEKLDRIPTVTLAARLIFDKGISEYIDAIKILNKRGVAAKYRVVGDLDLGNVTSATEQDVKNWADIGNIEILGHQDDIPTILEETNIVVLPSYREGLPKVLMEAAACGRAVITTDVPGCRDAIKVNETGLLIPAKNAKALANAIEKLIQDTELRVKMGIAGRQLAETEFAIEKIVQEHIEIYMK